jgi:hypothetical protein
MRLAGSPVGQHPELGGGIIKLRLVSHYDCGASGGCDGREFPFRSKVGIKMWHIVQEIEFGAA